MAEVYVTRPGHRDLLALPDELRERVKTKLRTVSEDPARYLRRLRGEDLYVLRVGDHRAILDWDRAGQALYVHAIGHRRNVYDREL